MTLEEFKRKMRAAHEYFFGKDAGSTNVGSEETRRGKYLPGQWLFILHLKMREALPTPPQDRMKRVFIRTIFYDTDGKMLYGGSVESISIHGIN